MYHDFETKNMFQMEVINAIGCLYFTSGRTIPAYLNK